jgi:glycine C-acetyltransferase
MDITEAPSGNAENFSLRDFMQFQDLTIQEQARRFSQYFRQTQAAGLSMYMREAQGEASHRMHIKDPQSGEVRDMVMLGSNNYLGLTDHPLVKQRVRRAIDEFGIGAGGPPLLNGTSRIHRELEERLAALKGADDAMLFSSGFMANLGWVTALAGKQDLILFDELNHASLFDGLRMARCRAEGFGHNHLQDLTAKLVKARANGHLNIYVVIEGVYSMDGDLGCLPEIRLVCQEYGAILVIDDAHGTGVMGQGGAGTAEHFGLHGQIDLQMGTFSKTFGTTGGFLAARQDLIDFLRFFSRSYMFSAHLPPPVVASVLGGLEVMEREPERIEQLRANVKMLVEGLNGLGFGVTTASAIIPVMIPVGVDLRRLARRLHDMGIFANPVEYPAVPLDQQRLRLSVMATHTEADLQQTIRAFETVKSEFNLV